MEFNDYTKIVFYRIQNFEPETEKATKIMGYLLLKDNPEEIMGYAFGTDQQIHSLVNEAKANLSLSSQFLSPRTISQPFSSPSSFRVSVPHLPPCHPTDFVRSPYNRILQSQAELANFGEQLHAISPLGLDYSGNCFYPDYSITGSRSPPNLPKFRPKHCHFFYKGYCKHGNSCKYIHGRTSPDRLSYDPKEIIVDDHSFYPGSLEQLEVEISELLKECEGRPVSIASLPSMYLEKYGKTLQAEGYLTESQRQGKAGFNLTKLLSQLNSIQLIDRPHGQHAVVPAEDAPKYGYKDDRNESGAVLPSSHQIYLTFPADSSFTDEDVSNYFEKFGPVCDVRIPHQEKRMFGFVSFHDAETVRTILAKSLPHHICGSRVLVKPYKEKTRMWDRKYIERAEFLMYHPPEHFGMEPEIQTIPRGYVNSCLPRKQPPFAEELEVALELERRRILGLQLSPKPLTPQTYFNNVTEYSETPADHFSPLHVATSDEKHQQTAKKTSDQESNNIELPESPFSF